MPWQADGGRGGREADRGKVRGTAVLLLLLCFARLHGKRVVRQGEHEMLHGLFDAERMKRRQLPHSNRVFSALNPPCRRIWPSSTFHGLNYLCRHVCKYPEQLGRIGLATDCLVPTTPLDSTSPPIHLRPCNR